MKKYILIAIVALASTSLYAQETKLTLEAIPGKLAEQLTQEQMETVTELTLTGEMYNCDFYTIRDKMPKLIFLDLKEALADTIPDRAFLDVNNLTIILSKETAYIGTEAFKCHLESITFTGKYPQLGDYIWGKDLAHRDFEVLVSDDNPYCCILNNCIYSSDMKTLYLAIPLYNFIKGDAIMYGTEIIGKGAFESLTIRTGSTISIPASVSKIQTNAFRAIEIAVPTGNSSSRSLYFYCYALIPPELGDNVFDTHKIYSLGVPKESLELYLSSTKWNNSFNEIYAIDDTPPSRLSSTKCKSSVSINEDVIHIQSYNVISKVSLFDSKGLTIDVIKPQAKECFMKCPLPKTFFFLYIHYNNGNTDIIKI